MLCFKQIDAEGQLYDCGRQKEQASWDRMATSVSSRLGSVCQSPVRREPARAATPPACRVRDVNLQREKSMDSPPTLRLTAYRIFSKKMCHMSVKC